VLQGLQNEFRQALRVYYEEVITVREN
jgi:hypothetical protein